jgi:hypothetical protein
MVRLKLRRYISAILDECESYFQRYLCCERFQEIVGRVRDGLKDSAVSLQFFSLK